MKGNAGPGAINGSPREWRRFDRLPKAIRRALTQAPRKYSAEEAFAWWKEARSKGYSQSEFIRLMRTVFQRAVESEARAALAQPKETEHD